MNCISEAKIQKALTDIRHMWEIDPMHCAYDLDNLAKSKRVTSLYLSNMKDFPKKANGGHLSRRSHTAFFIRVNQYEKRSV